MPKKIIFDPFATNLPTYVEALIKRAVHNLQTCIPAIVKEVVSRNEVVVTPAVQQMDADWQSVAWADIKLPVRTPCGNNLLISCPLTAGDTGWIIAGDLDPSLFFKDPSKPANQNLLTRHDYQYGFFLPDKIGKLTLEDSDGGIHIGTADGKTKILIKDGEISIESTSELKIMGKNITINTDDNSSVVIDGVNFKEHQHAATGLTTTATVGTGAVGVIEGNTGGVI